MASFWIEFLSLFRKLTILSFFILMINFCLAGEVIWLIWRILSFASWFASVSVALQTLGPLEFAKSFEPFLVVLTLCACRYLSFNDYDSFLSWACLNIEACGCLSCSVGWYFDLESLLMHCSLEELLLKSWSCSNLCTCSCIILRGLRIFDSLLEHLTLGVPSVEFNP